MTAFWSIVLIILSTILSSLGSFYMKVASSTVKLNIKTVITNMPLIGALTLHTLSAIVGVIAYRGGELTVLVPLASLNYILASLLAIKFLGEKMNSRKWTGIVGIVVGITLIGLGDVI